VDYARRLRAVANVGLIVVLTAVMSQRWTGFNSPDSEFYASLALFGSDVTDRAIEPAYTPTRLGYIVPVRAVVTVLGPWLGFEFWRWILISTIVISTYSVVLLSGRSRVLATMLTLGVSLNTVLLAFVGNTYLTGTILAGFFVLMALAVSMLGSGQRAGGGRARSWLVAGSSGALVGWLLMLNPYALLLGAGLWASVRIVVLVLFPIDRWRRLLLDAAGGLLGFLITVGLLLLAGRAVFPRMNWWQTYTEWNSRLDYTVFVGDWNVWQRDSALLVVVIAVIASTVAALVHPRRRWAWAALALSLANVLITAVIMVVLPGPWLETPTYIAKLWPAALLSLVLVFCAVQPGTKEGLPLHQAPLIAGIAVLVTLMLLSGRFDGSLTYPTALAIAAGMAFLIIAAILASGRSWSAWTAALGVVGILAAFIGAQFLQNGRGNLGIYGQYPFRSAYVDFNYQDQMASKIAIQEWILSRTAPDDHIALWTDVDRLTADVAGMQLWGGYNIFTTEAVLDRAGIERLEEFRPTVVAMYAPTHEEISRFHASLPAWALPSELECTSEPYLGIGSGAAQVCITRLTWVG